MAHTPFHLPFSLLIILTLCNDFVLNAAFVVHQPARRSAASWYGTRQRLSKRTEQHSFTIWPLLLSRDSQDSTVITSTNNNRSDGNNTSKPSTDGKIRIQRSQVEIRLQEMHDRNAKGENLTQEYCDSILGLCVASDEWDNVLDILDVMKKQNLSQERSTYRACLQSCFEMGNGSSAQEILKAMDLALVTPEPLDISLVVASMCRNNQREHGWWKQALSLLRDRKSVNVPVETYDVVISCMVDEKRWKDALQLLREMEQGGKKRKKRVHPKPALSTYREVVECCVAAQKAEQSVQVLLSMTEQGIKPTVYTFELVISALAKKLQWRRALQLLDLMDELDVPKTIVTYNTVISACSRAREVGMAKNLLARMRKSGIRPNVITFNSLISACASTSRWKDAMSLFSECSREPGISPDIYTYTNAMRACAKGGKTQRALSLFQVAKDKGLDVDSYCYTAVIEACAKARMWKKALDLLAEMEMKGVEPSGVTYSVTISACGNGGQWEKALNLLEVMRGKGMSINLITYNSAITALSKAAKQSAKAQVPSKQLDRDYNAQNSEGRLWTRVMDLLDQMKQDGISPDGFSFSAAISCCGAEGRWKEALELIDLMQKGGPRTRPNRIAYTAAITACGRSGQHEYALKLFRDMKDQGLSADRVAYNALFSALRESKKTDTTYELWGEMCGTRSSNTTAKIATAKADKWTTPDIITVTDVIAVLSKSERREDVDRVDSVFSEAVRRGIVLQADSLDSSWEVDLSGMSFPVARAACRYIIRRLVSSTEESLCDLTLITGVGRMHRRPILDDSSTGGQFSWSAKDATTKDSVRVDCLREYVREVLKGDFDPPLESFVPERAQGTVQINKEDLEGWMNHQQKHPSSSRNN